MKTEKLVKGRGANLPSQHNSLSHWVDLFRFENKRDPLTNDNERPYVGALLLKHTVDD